ncbi:MAG: pro-sigmaK processing inhibitor BofA family protein [Syntrophomonadaceae bacterium]|jgi:inhibitor of the pro-sigma K processing machinery
METINVIIAALFFLVILYIMAQVIVQPMKLLWKLVINSAIGLVLLMITNYLGGYFSFNVPVNIITILLAGFLGIPGIILIICFQIIVR